MPYIAKLTAGETPSRDSIGGYPFLPVSMKWPICAKSGQPMVLFFQLDVRPEFGLSLAAGTHLAVFTSPVVNDIATRDQVRDGQPLPAKFWETRPEHFKTFVFGPDVALVAQAEPDRFLVHAHLAFEKNDDPRDPFLVIGGAPRWYQDPETHPGFDFVCQLSEGFPFEKRAEAPKQPFTFSNDAYALFLGNSSYFFTRPEPLDEEEVWVVLQN